MINTKEKKKNMDMIQWALVMWEDVAVLSKVVWLSLIDTFEQTLEIDEAWSHIDTYGRIFHINKSALQRSWSESVFEVKEMQESQCGWNKKRQKSKEMESERQPILLKLFSILQYSLIIQFPLF